MSTLFGDRATFAVEVGEYWSRDLRYVDLWAGGKHLTIDDNLAFVSTVSGMMRDTVAKVRNRAIRSSPFPDRSPEEIFRLLEADGDELAEQYWFLHWDEIVDNVSPSYAYLDGDLMFLFAFWREEHPVPEDLGRVFVARIPPKEFVSVVEAAADLLESEDDTRPG